jgi:hypothetical protein
MSAMRHSGKASRSRDDVEGPPGLIQGGQGTVPVAGPALCVTER